MFVASKDISKRLFSISGWKDQVWVNATGAPVYGLGFILRKLPPYIPTDTGRAFLALYRSEQGWKAGYLIGREDNEELLYPTDDDFAEDVVCRLAIELFNDGVLPNTKQGTMLET